MSEDTKTVEVVCVKHTFDEENYVAGRTYHVSESLVVRYPDSFRSLDWKDPAEAEQKQLDTAREDLARLTQEGYERARDHAVLMEAQSDLERARQRRELEEQLRRQREENRKADLAGVESTGWQPKPPPKHEPLAEAPAPRARTSAPAHTLPRAERLKHASK